MSHDLRGGIFAISLDFEIHWGNPDAANLDANRKKLLGVRQAVPALLDLFQKYDIHVTWAMVGFLFFRSRQELTKGLPLRKPPYFDSRLSPYESLAQIGENEAEDPFHYAPSMIEKIISSKNQEIGTHTFSHYYCLEQGQTAADFREDLRAAQTIAGAYGRKLESLVFPRNQINEDYLDICSELGIMAYRGTEQTWFYRSKDRTGYRRPWRRMLRLMDSYLNLSGPNSYPIRETRTSLLNIPASRYLRPYSRKLSSFEGLRSKRITSAMEYAARSGHIFHLWWHPEGFGTHLAENLGFLEVVLGKFKQLEDDFGMRSLNMGEIARLNML